MPVSWFGPTTNFLGTQLTCEALGKGSNPTSILRNDEREDLGQFALIDHAHWDGPTDEVEERWDYKWSVESDSKDAGSIGGNLKNKVKPADNEANVMSDNKQKFERTAEWSNQASHRSKHSQIKVQSVEEDWVSGEKHTSVERRTKGKGSQKKLRFLEADWVSGEVITAREAVFAEMDW
ncbi:MAG: hypothetical protein M1825_001032 [Sarcosagium campestre]|nr:MAG: hypothetical protein M1825_001032 [Sarcosagium campestre]